MFRKIGEKIKIKDKTFVVVEGSCEECCFDKSGDLCIKLKKELGHCINFQTDCNDKTEYVAFKEVCNGN